MVEYFGFYYKLNDDNKTCRLDSATSAKGRVIIPDFIEWFGKKYKVTDFGRDGCAFYYTTPSDKRIKDKSKFPIHILDNFSPFSKCNPEEIKERCITPNTTVTYVKLPDTINVLLNCAFLRCAALEEVVLPKGITQIPRRCFSECIALKTIQLHEGIKEILEKAFSGCSALTEITIPSSVTYIGREAFSGCSALTEITIPSSVTKIGESAFSIEALKVVNILNDEGAVLMFPNSFPDGVKINYLGKKAAKQSNTTEKAANSGKSASIDLEKLIQAALADGEVTEKERSILVKKVKEAGSDVDEFEMLLDARIFEANKMNTKTEPKPAANHTAATKPTATQKGRQTVGALTEAFKKQFGAVLRIYNGRSKADDSISLQDVGLTQEISTSFDGKQKVGDFIAQMANVGLKVKVYTSDEWVAVLDSLSLEQAGKVKKNATKADMEKML